jgi:hypothetical protein
MANNTTITTYDQEYFSSAQINIYLGDVLIDEITSLQIQVTQRKMPIYGYSSQLFDKVAAGTVIVQGEFSINFKEAGYLNIVLKRFKELEGKNPLISSSTLMDKSRGGITTSTGKNVLQRKNIEELVGNIAIGENGGVKLTNEELIEYYQSLSGMNNKDGALNQAESTFEAFEDRIWGKEDLSNRQSGRRADSNIYDNFTMYITFGDYNRNNNVNHTSKRIDNVFLTGQSQSIQNDGNPAQEVYSFFARNYV